MSNAKLYNLVLSGGGVRGYAHIGVLQALFEQGLKISAISATSAGALVGAFVCDGYHPVEIKEIILKETPQVKLNIWGIKNGILSFEQIKKLLDKYLRTKKLEQLTTPLMVSATNLLTGTQHVFSEGNIIDCLMAASSIPVLFEPVVIENVPYADGGLSSNLPVEVFRKSDEKIIGVHVNPPRDYRADDSTAYITDRTAHIVLKANIASNISRCHIFIEPPELSRFHMFEHKNSAGIIQAGYDFTKQNVAI